MDAAYLTQSRMPFVICVAAHVFAMAHATHVSIIEVILAIGSSPFTRPRCTSLLSGFYRTVQSNPLPQEMSHPRGVAGVLLP